MGMLGPVQKIVDPKCMALAACIRRAERDNPGTGPENDRYWYTREKCAELAQELGIGIGELISVSYRIDTYDKKLDVKSSPFWDEVKHPDILCAEIMDR